LPTFARIPGKIAEKVRPHHRDVEEELGELVRADGIAAAVEFSQAVFIKNK
jgi:hypothetical protein